MFKWSIEKSLKQNSSDWFLAAVVVVLCTAFFISIWTVHLAESKPELLWPAAIFTLIFRLISPIYLIKIVRKLSTDNLKDDGKGSFYIFLN